MTGRSHFPMSGAGLWGGGGEGVLDGFRPQVNDDDDEDDEQ